jgi:murein DD-endopeptidase MepM/ murein hydrolase activator NlpD
LHEHRQIEYNRDMSITRTRLRFSSILLIVILVCPLTSSVSGRGQTSCGVVDAIDYPVDSVSIVSDDFGMYRSGFNGRHSGIDINFDHYGDPVRAAARGRVTFSDPAGWDTEKGVVIVEHTMPDDSIVFTVYGHMEEINGHAFPNVGDCVDRGEVVGAEGHPSHSAPHLHYEIRKMEASTGGPGYWNVDPLDGGWMHPIDFTEQWRLRLNPSFRSILTAGGGPIAPPLRHEDGTVTFAEEYHLEQRSPESQTIWRLDIQGLTGIIDLPDGRILGSTTDDQVIIVDSARARFAASWKPNRGLQSPPLRLADSVVFLTADNRAVSYSVDGEVIWQTDPIGDHLERYAQSGDRLAVSAGQEQSFRLWVIDSTGKVLYQTTSQNPIMPIAAPQGGFYILTGGQIALLGPDTTLRPLMDVGLILGRDAQIARDPDGNVFLYPGQGQRIYSYTANGRQRWQAVLAFPATQPPLVGVGAGCLAYVLTADGGLLAYRASDGALRGFTSLYAGGNHGHPASRFLKVSPNDQVQFSAGYLSIATIDGPTLSDDCKPSTAH